MVVPGDVTPFEVRVERGTVLVQGEIDLATVGEVEAAIDTALAIGPVVCDLGAVTFIDSTGVRLLDALLRRGRRITFRLPRDPAGRQVLDMTELTAQLPLEPE